MRKGQCGNRVKKKGSRQNDETRSSVVYMNCNAKRSAQLPEAAELENITNHAQSQGSPHANGAASDRAQLNLDTLVNSSLLGVKR
jgi:hypothetical protein